MGRLPHGHGRSHKTAGEQLVNSIRVLLGAGAIVWADQRGLMTGVRARDAGAIARSVGKAGKRRGEPGSIPGYAKVYTF